MIQLGGRSCVILSYPFGTGKANKNVSERNI